jgi:hypothetical protein
MQYKPLAIAGLLAACMLQSVAVAAPVSALSPGDACMAAGRAAESAEGIPNGLLLAIGQVESGRRDPDTGVMAPWPWSLNIAGDSRVFDTQAAALAALQEAQARGVASVDVGCFQINLLHHPAAFASLPEALDPAANAAYAARFLASLRLKAGTWETAVALYHSAEAERGLPYRDAVLTRWAGHTADPLSSYPAASDPFVIKVGAAIAANGWPRVWGPPALSILSNPLLAPSTPRHLSLPHVITPETR